MTGKNITLKDAPIIRPDSFGGGWSIITSARDDGNGILSVNKKYPVPQPVLTNISIWWFTEYQYKVNEGDYFMFTQTNGQRYRIDVAKVSDEEYLKMKEDGN